MTWQRRWNAWLAETHGSLFELTRHFLRQMLSTELVSSREHLDRFLIGVLAALPGLGAILPRVYFHKYSFLRTADYQLYLSAVRADRLFFVSMSMLLIGFATVLLWQSLFPSRRDYLVLRSLPLSLSNIFLGRFISVLLVEGLLIVDANITISLAFPLASQNGQSYWQYAFAHGVATMSAGVFVVFAMMALQGVLMNLLPARWFEAVSVFLQAIFLLGSFLAVPLAFSLPNLYREIEAHPAWMTYVPPGWFLGIYEELLGAGNEYYRSLASSGARALAAAIAVSLLAYFVSYRRYAARATTLLHNNAAPTFGRAAGWLRSICFPHSEQEAVAGFAAATLRRSRPHKLLLVVYLGVAAAIALDSAGTFGMMHRGIFQSRGGFLEMQVVLAVPFMVSMLIVYGLLHVFRLPSEPRANWVFQMADHEGAADFLAPVSKSLAFAAVLPVAMITPFATAYALGWRIAVLHTIVASLVALIIAESKINDWDRIPFTCSYVAGKRPFFQTASMAGLVFTLLTTFVTGIEGVMLRNGGVAIYVTIGLLLFWYFRKVRAREEFWRQSRVVFEEDMNEYMRLGITGE